MDKYNRFKYKTIAKIQKIAFYFDFYFGFFLSVFIGAHLNFPDITISSLDNLTSAESVTDN